MILGIVRWFSVQERLSILMRKEHGLGLKLFYTVPEAARKANCHPETMRRYGKLGMVPGWKKVGERWVFERAPFDEWLAEQQGKGEAA